MFKKIRKNFDSWDVKSFVLTILVVAGVLFIVGILVFSDIRDRFRSADKERFEGRTIAKIISIKPIEKMKQGKFGTTIKVDAFEVSYSYKVDGQTFQDSDLIPVNAGNMKFLRELSDMKTNDSVKVAFDVSAPRNSVLIDGQ
jgi:hypothetical protein